MNDPTTKLAKHPSIRLLIISNAFLFRETHRPSLGPSASGSVLYRPRQGLRRKPSSPKEPTPAATGPASSVPCSGFPSCPAPCPAPDSSWSRSSRPAPSPSPTRTRSAPRRPRSRRDASPCPDGRGSAESPGRRGAGRCGRRADRR